MFIRKGKIMKNQVLDTIKKRSSARAYSSENLTEEELNAIIEAGLQAPTAKNERELHFSVIAGNHPILKELDDEVNKLKGQDKAVHNFYYEAPVFIVISAKDDFKWSKVDAGIAVSNMALAAESMGLGNLIIGCVYDALYGEKKAYFENELKIPEGYSYAIALAVGHRTDNKKPHDYVREEQVSVIE